jgi:hypothetical protein
MNDLYNRLSVLKLLLNSHYGDAKVNDNIYQESYRIRKRIECLKLRKQKINKVFNERY